MLRPEKLKELATLLRIISNETRLRILHLLTWRELCVCEIMAELSLGQSLVSHHLAVLRKCDLVCDRRDAQWVYYAINVEKLDELNELYLSLFDVSKVSTGPRLSPPPISP